MHCFPNPAGLTKISDDLLLLWGHGLICVSRDCNIIQTVQWITYKCNINEFRWYVYIYTHIYIYAIAPFLFRSTCFFHALLDELFEVCHNVFPHGGNPSRGIEMVLFISISIRSTETAKTELYSPSAKYNRYKVSSHWQANKNKNAQNDTAAILYRKEK